LTSRTAIMMMMQTDFRNLDSPDFKKSIFGFPKVETTRTS
jgi:hypothetical protein